MGAPIQGIPAMPGASPEASPTMSSLVPPQNTTPSPDIQELAKAAMMQIRQLSINADTLAAQFPVAAPDLQVASKALQQAMVKIVSDINRTQTSPPTPAMVS